MDYEDRIQNELDYLIEEYEEHQGYAPNGPDLDRLYEEAKDKVDSMLEAHADWMRKRAKGE